MEADLHVIRALLGLSCEELGQALGVSRQTISNIERGKSPFAKVYKLALHYLVDTKYQFEIPKERVKLIKEMLNN